MPEEKQYRDAKTGEYVTEEFALANPDTTVSETIEKPLEFSDQDVADLASLGITDGEEPTYHTILEVWRSVLAPAAVVGRENVTPQWCNRMVQTYTDLHFKDCLELRDRYYAKLAELCEIIVERIESDPECLNYTSAEEDRVENAQHYKELLTDWQVRFLQWELDWRPTDEHAAVELAAISEVHKIMFSDMGLLAHLEQIKFEFTEQDKAALGEALEARRVEVNGE